jgi:aerobic carbon-monoxide dehydrogenase medium subunit
MIPAKFDYEVAGSIDEAIELLGREDAKLLAGGHSLLPLMKLRLARPALLVDIGRLSDLSYVRDAGEGLAVGALTRHHDLAAAALIQEHCPLLSYTAGLIGDPQVRHRGTIGGSLAHGDPASDLPAVMLALEGEVSAQGSGGLRTIAAADLFQDYLTTSLAHDEVITEVRLPAIDGLGYGYEKFTRRAEDWAMVGVCALVKRAGDGSCEDVRIGLTHMGSTPLRATAAEEALRGQGLDASSIAAAAQRAADGTEPPGDLNATPDYKRHLAQVLTRRALEAAAAA